jgi:hypothetical protein
MNYPKCSGYCQQGRIPCACDPYQDEPSPRLVRWLDEHPMLAPVLMVAFLLLTLVIGGLLDGGPL